FIEAYFKVNPKVSIVLSSTSAGDIVGLISCVKVAARTNQTKLTTKFLEKCATRTIYKQKGIRCSDAPAKSTTGSIDKGLATLALLQIHRLLYTSPMLLPIWNLKLINRQHPKSIQFSRTKCKSKCYHRLTLYLHISCKFFYDKALWVIKKRRDALISLQRWFHLWLRREERKTAFSGNRTLPLFLFSRTHVNSVIVVHEKKYSLEELQIMVDDMDYGLRLTIRTVSRRVL
ncbi:LOW QUALITY PROTEIN: hypothetical protein HID58_006295, partial [Brassica napus]